MSKRPVPVDMPLRYYTAAMHSASFVLPGSSPGLNAGLFSFSPHTYILYMKTCISPAKDDGQTSPSLMIEKNTINNNSESSAHLSPRRTSTVSLWNRRLRISHECKMRRGIFGHGSSERQRSMGGGGLEPCRVKY